jgi:hypothetical protein
MAFSEPLSPRVSLRKHLPLVRTLRNFARQFDEGTLGGTKRQVLEMMAAVVKGWARRPQNGRTNCALELMFVLK